MEARRALFFVVLIFCTSLTGWAQNRHTSSPPKNGGDFSSNTQPTTKVPSGVILVKGAWSSASDSITPLPEDGAVANNVFSNHYFGLTYALPLGWTEQYKGPPPSENGRYVLAQIGPPDTYKGQDRGSILFLAEDMFFTRLPVANPLEFVSYTKDHLQADYKVEAPPTEVRIAGHLFSFFAYGSPVAHLHWYTAATEIRCHAVQIVLTSQDTKLLEKLFLGMNTMTLPAETSLTEGHGGGAIPVCIKDYANDENVIARVDPLFSEHKANPVPVRIIIDKEGKVKHVHFLSAFPDQTKAITDALAKWQFRPYLQDGKPVEVETGIVFGRGLRPSSSIEPGMGNTLVH